MAPLTPAARPRRILVIEDNLDAALTLKMLLELSGHQVATAHTARTGLAKVRQQQPEVVFCDIGLPDTDGYTVAEALRADPAGRPPFLVAYPTATAYPHFPRRPRPCPSARWA